MKKRKTIGTSTASTLKTQNMFSNALFSQNHNSKAVKSGGKLLESQTVERSPLSSRNENTSAGSSQLGAPTAKPEPGITRFSAAELRSRPRGKTDWAKFDALTDEDIARAVADDPDAAPIDLDWSNAKIYYPKGKLPVSLRIDADVFAFFKGRGRGYQTRINAILRSYMEHELNKKPRK